MNRYPLWKYLVIGLVIMIGVVYSLPNLFPPDPALQIITTDSRYTVNANTQNTATEALTASGIEHFGVELSEKNLLIRLKNEDEQLNAKQQVQIALGDDYVVAQNRASTTPDWLTALGAAPMSLGLDLSGGVHFLMEVDMDSYLEKQLEDYTTSIMRQFREEKIRYRKVDRAKGDGLSLAVVFRDELGLDDGSTFLRRNLSEFNQSGLSGEEFGLKLTLTDAKVQELQDYAITQNLVTLKNRVNEIGVAEPLVARQGIDRIVVELPGIQDTATAGRILQKSANLEFRLEAEPGERRSEIFEFRNPTRQRTAELEKAVIITGENVTNAQLSFDEQGMPQVSITLDSAGGTRMGQTTKVSVGRAMGVLFIEQKTKTQWKVIDGKQTPIYSFEKSQGIISLATIRGAFSNQFVITGLESTTEASELALLLRAGALAAPMKIVNERTIGPSLGQDNIDLGVKSVTIGFALVIIFMVLYYRVFGLFANVALTVNLVMIIGVLSMLSASLTLPGIAGIVLTVGMAVDANVLIFSRIREELKNGLPNQSAIQAGYDRAFTTILDANITTFIVAIILFAVGTGPIKGFAVTLAIGILTSMFTAIMVTRALVNLVYGGREIKSVSIWEIWKWQN